MVAVFPFSQHLLRLQFTLFLSSFQLFVISLAVLQLNLYKFIIDLFLYSISLIDSPVCLRVSQLLSDLSFKTALFLFDKIIHPVANTNRVVILLSVEVTLVDFHMHLLSLLIRFQQLLTPYIF